jgi:DNA polymerase-1
VTPASDKKLFLLDAFALIYRAYFAFSRNPLINSKGMNVSAISGFTSTLFDLLTRENPTHIAIAFDTLGPTDRESEFAEYKANREAAPEDIVMSIPIIKEIIEGFNIPIIEVEGYEADDVIGTLAKKAEKDGYQVYMVTPDKDFGQLVSDNIFMYKPAYKGAGFDVLGKKEILEKWEVDDVSKVIDILGMWGDAVDNIPGIPGVGEKTAKKLVNEYGSMEGVLEHADEIKGKLGEKIRDNKEQALMSKRLATIITDTPMDIDEETLLRTEADKEKLAKLFNELEFRNIAKRVLGEEFLQQQDQGQIGMFANGDGEVISDQPAGATAESIDHQYELVADKKAQQDLVKEMLKQKVVCFDTETTGLDAHTATLVGMSFSWKAHNAYYVPAGDDIAATLKIFEPVFLSKDILKIGQNIKYDILILQRAGIDVAAPIYDTMLAHYLIEPELRHNMDFLAENYLGYKPIPITDLIGPKGKNQKSMADLAPEEIVDYAAEDADITFQLWEKLNPEVDTHNARKVLDEIELPLVKVLADMELEGVRVDRDVLMDYSLDLAEEILSTEQTIFKIAGSEFNLASPRQLGDVLFDKMEIPYTGRKTKTGQYSTNEEVLTKLANEHEIAQHIMSYRELTKLKSTYVDALPALINEETGRIHTSFNQAVAATGRLSSADPNLQNIPIRTARGREVRKAFVSRDKDHLLLSSDYSQVELRLVAEISGDEAMQEAFLEGVDIHTTTAAKVFHVDMDKVTDEMRRKAKVVNFGIIYGISAFGLSQRLNIPRAESKELIENYFASYPKIKESMDASIEFAKKHGYVETIMGRRRYLRDINSRNFTVRGFAERNAINAPIQGSAADLIKIAMINIDAAMRKKKMRSKMILQVHDELVFDTHKDELEDLQKLVEDLMKNAIKLKVPIEVDSGHGSNWLEAH